jgi:hypothetical protein
MFDPGIVNVASPPDYLQACPAIPGELIGNVSGVAALVGEAVSR